MEVWIVYGFMKYGDNDYISSIHGSEEGANKERDRQIKLEEDQGDFGFFVKGPITVKD